MQSLKQEILDIEKSLAEQTSPYVAVTVPVPVPNEQAVGLTFPKFVEKEPAPEAPKITGCLDQVKVTSTKLSKKEVIEPVVAEAEPETETEPKLSKKERSI